MKDVCYSFRNVRLSQIAAVSERARDVAPVFESRTGLPFIYFQRGEVAYPTPKFLADAFQEAFQKGMTRYPKVGGEDFFKDAVLDDLLTEGLFALSRENLVATYGGQEGLQLSLSMFRGASVACFTPCWSCIYDNLIPYSECHLSYTVPLIDSDGEWKIDWERFEMSIKLVDIFYFNTPHNPTGKVFSTEEVEKIVSLCKKHDVLLLCDEAYRELAYTKPHVSPLYFDYDNIIMVNTFSKSFAATGLRIGYAVSKRADWIERMRLADYSQTAGVSTPTQYAISKALRHHDRDEWSVVYKAHMAESARIMGDNLKIGTVSAPVEGAFYRFIKMFEAPIVWTAAKKQEDEIVEQFLQQGIAVVPGSAFGSEFVGYVRLSFSALSHAHVREGSRRFSEVFAEVAKS